MVDDFPKAIIGYEVKEFSELCVALVAEGATSDGGVKDAKHDEIFGGVFNSKRDGKSHG